ncbi:carboxypeptidase regulatory-like domain-containing protein [Niastella caeni]|uniref:Carboxypeptidase regulatory-like domain-containing protein n=1 Tax=Niastella caeni TaxID=2569763 RepID=A0A4S8HXR7_9BACT|nr:carboxypeptidase regulatory-like domain-containing protein [Niastella caeni]THU38032.1 carboxypeptidase regulatory-like domain-containing protein [Niastella caeni]
MDKTVATLIGIIGVVIGLHATRAMQETNITGKVFSARDSVWVYAVSGKDSLKTMVNNGKFRFTVKPGSWKVMVTENKLFNDDGKLVEVVEGSTLDMGTIILN